MNWYEWGGYKRFHQMSIVTGDIDPVYPVLARVVAPLSDDQRVVAVLLHVAYYHLASSLAALDRYLDGTPISQLPHHFPAGTERRAHRSPRALLKHLAALDEWLDNAPARRIDTLIDPDPAVSFNALVAELGTVYGNGRWASYKSAEMLWKVAGYPLAATRLEIEGSSGPAAGLRVLAPFSRPTEGLAYQLMADLAIAGLPAAPEQVETTLCDFHALTKGAYYVGHDIDQMLGQLTAPGIPHWGSWRAAMRARQQVLPPAYLGELHGWHKPDLSRKRIYKATGVVELRR